MISRYSNENFPLDTVIVLRQVGYDVLTSYEAGQANQGLADEAVLAFATAQNRSVITLNRDDFIQLHQDGISHAGIIICKDDRDYIDQAQALHSYLTTQPDLTKRLIRVKKRNQPKSNTQVFVVQAY